MHNDAAARDARIRWFQQDRFGLFIHWGLYAIPARGEWVLSTEQMPQAAYDRYFDAFDPVGYDPAHWARVAKRAGMRYAVLTTKHHDGFCLFDSALTDYKATNTKAGRDLVREYVDAFRAEGLKVGFYYSLLDWHHPDYPAFGDRQHPQRENEALRGAKHNFDAYLDYMHGQIRELMTNYGQIDLLWTDFSYDHMAGEAWRATELVRMVRSLQPNILLNSRLEGSGEAMGSLMGDVPTEISGDFTCPEMLIPAQGLKTPSGRPVPWEACITLNNHWGYAALDKEYKSADMLVRKLVECVSKNGNLLLNVGPDAKGRIPLEQEAILLEIGRWMAQNGESIYGCGAADLPKPDWGRFTQKGDTLYAHVLDEPVGPLWLPGMAGKVEAPRRVEDGSELFIAEAWNTVSYPDDLFISQDAFGVATHAVPQGPDRVVKMRLKA